VVRAYRKADLKVRLYESNLQTSNQRFAPPDPADVEADLFAYAKAMADPP